MSSFSTSFIPSYPEESILDNIANVAENLGQQQYTWAGNQFASNSTLTDSVVNNFLTASQKDMSLADNMTNRYENTFQPQEDALVRDANTYASDARVRSEMGRAESDTGQALDAGKANAEQTLQSYGIDPSSGRYAELDRAEDAKRAAAQAQAGQVARYNTEATGRQLRDKAIQVGQQYPGQIVNSLNNAMQGFAGAENAKLSNTNTGVNAFDSADKFMNTAMALKYPPLGNTSTRGTIINSTPSQNGSNGNSGSRAGPGGGPGSGGGGFSPFGSSGGGNNGGGNNGSFNGSGAGANGFTGGTNARIINTGYDDTGFGGENGTGAFDETGFQDAFGDQGNAGQDYPPIGGAGSEPTDSFSGYDQNYDNYSGSPSQDYGGSTDAGNSGDYGFDPSAGGGDYSDSGGGYDSGDYASGGAIPDGNGPTTGGFVPPQASPTGGAQTDDVNAHVNVGEFVIPRDVALWKGQEFFQKLIEQSRQKRGAAPAKGKPSNRPTNGSPSFVSQAAG